MVMHGHPVRTNNMRLKRYFALTATVLASAPKRVTDKLQSVLNAAACLITGTQK